MKKYPSYKNIKMLINSFSISSLFYNFLIKILPDLGINKEELEKHTRFKIQKVINERISLAKAYRLWINIEKLSKRSDIGLIIADRFTMSEAGIIGELFFYSKNLKESVDILNRFLPIIMNNIYSEYEEDEKYSYFYFDMAPKFLIPLSALECYIKICYNWSREYVGSNLPVEEINFIYDKPPHYFSYYKKNFPNVKINFNQPRNFIVLKKELFYMKNKRKILTPYSLIIKHADKIKKEINAKYSFTQRIINKILITMPEGKNSIESISKIMNISPSTIKRNLKKENTTFTKLTEMLRKKLAYVLLKDTKYSFEEISYLLGYSEYSPFFRAFKKWFNISPSDFRSKPFSYVI